MEHLDKYNLNLAGEYRVASELMLRGVHASITFGNKKGADILAVGVNRRAAVIEVKASQKKKCVTGLYQKYKTVDAECPDFWVLYSVTRTESAFMNRFFILSHREMAKVQGETNCPRQELTHEQYADRAKSGVDNVRFTDVETYEDQWEKILVYCNSPLKMSPKC